MKKGRTEHAARHNEGDDRIAENERRLRALLMATSDVIYRMSPDWKVMHTLEGKGFLADTGEPIDNWMQKYIHPDDQQMVQQRIDKAVRTKSIFELEHQVLQNDGTLGWIFSRAIPILDEQGEILEWFGAASDITKRKRAELELKRTTTEQIESRRLYEAITGSTPDLIYVFDLDYHFIYANQALLNMWGQTWEEAIGKRLPELGYEPWHAEMHEREIDLVAATKKTIRGEVSFPHAVLGRRMYDYIFAPVLNDKDEVVAVAGITRDISDLKTAEDALKQSEEQFRTLTQFLPQLIWTAEPDGYYDFFNERWYNYTGSSPKLSCGDGWAQYIHPRHRDALYKKWRAGLDTGKPIVFEFQLKAKDGSYNWFYVLGNPIKDDEGNIRKWVGTLTNIDEQKAVEEGLEMVVRDRTKELQRSNEDLLQFAHVASHDLKEPVRKVKTFLSRLEKELGNELSDNGKLYLQKIYSATDRMNNMIEGVLAYSTVNDVEQAFTAVDLDKIIADIENDLEVLIQQKGAQIKSSNLGRVNGLPVLLYQLFYNLINNSLKFARDHVAPVISITAERLERDGEKRLLIRLQDNGIGFSQDQAERIFNTFTRLNSKDKYEGTGLGLALCKKIVERHDGTITATGEDDKGALFMIELPG